MSFVTLEAQPRTPGKKFTREARRQEQVPCVLYGAGTETISFQVQQLQLRDVVYTDQFKRVKIALDGKEFECILKRIDFDPIKDVPIHVDFQRLVDGKEIQLRVPVNYVGVAPGVLAGGTPQEFVNKISVRCLPQNIPDSIDVDISGLEIGQSVLLRDIEIEGVTFNASSDQTLIAVTRPRELVEPEDEELDEELEGVEGEEGAEGAEGEGSAEGGDDDGKNESDG